MKVLEARGLAVTRHGVTVAGPFDLDLDQGEVVLLEGASGSGKTTLLKAMGGLLRHAPGVAVEGRLHVADGLDPRGATARELATHVGQVFQVAEEQLLALDVEGEVAMRLENLGVDELRGVPRVERALREYGLASMAERETHALSAGEARRVALAAALVARPEVLLLDEPFTGLDPRWRERLAEDVERAKAKAGVVVTDHGGRHARAVADLVVPVRKADARPRPRARPTRGPVEPAPIRARARGVRLERGPEVVLENADFDLGPGFVALVGLNGSGKTSLLRALAGLDRPVAGDLRVDGLDRPHRAPPLEVARRLGFATHLSMDHFTAATVAEEIALTSAALARARGRTLVGREEGFHPAIAAQAFGLQHLMDRHPLALSGGERQRLAFAVATAHEPHVLLLDEPTVGLDDAGREALLVAVARVRERAGLVLAATHDEALIEEADRVLLLHQGRLRDEGPPETFFDGWGRRLGYERPGEAVA